MPNSIANLSFLENVFEMIDVNKWLKLKAKTEKQKNEAQQRENTLKELLKMLYIPTPIENV